MAYLGSPGQTKRLLRQQQFPIRKKYGQNFLIDKHILEEIIRIADIKKTDFVLEIGPGLGTMTQYLCESAKAVAAVEIDAKLIPILNETLQNYPNAEIIHGDILKTDIAELAREKNNGEPVKVVANLPYYITTPIVMELLENQEIVSDITIMVQKEVACRMCAQPGGKEYGALSLAVQYFAKPQIAADVPPESFLPRPDVESAVVRLLRRDEPFVQTDDPGQMFRLIRAAFGQRRKTLANSLFHAGGLSLSKEQIQDLIASLGLAADVRGEALTLAQFAALSNAAGRLQPKQA